MLFQGQQSDGKDITDDKLHTLEKKFPKVLLAYFQTDLDTNSENWLLQTWCNALQTLLSQLSLCV